METRMIYVFPVCPSCQLGSRVSKGKFGGWYCYYCHMGFTEEKEQPVSEQKAVTVQDQQTGVLMDYSPEYIQMQLAKVVHLMDKVLQRGDDGNGDYGVIPGTKKPTLFKPGAEKLCMMFRLAPRYRIEREYDGPHLTVTAICELYHIPTDALMGSGIGLCSSKESKYAYRQQNKVCPACGKEAIIKGKAEYGGGWFCFEKKGGCKAKFKDGDTSIESQKSGRAANEDIADQHNTVVKMACKRAYLDATLKATAASSIFTQDQDDSDEIRELREVKSEQPEPPPTPTPNPSSPPAVTKGAAPVPPDKPVPPMNPDEWDQGGLRDEGWNVLIGNLWNAKDGQAFDTISKRDWAEFGKIMSKSQRVAYQRFGKNMRAYFEKLEG